MLNLRKTFQLLPVRLLNSQLRPALNAEIENPSELPKKMAQTAETLATVVSASKTFKGDLGHIDMKTPRIKTVLLNPSLLKKAKPV